MAGETQIAQQAGLQAAAWPPDDTEESVLGSDLHQMTITNLRLGINEAAHLHAPAGTALPWQALCQVILLGCERPDRSPYRTMPDIFVYRHSIDQLRGSIAIASEGPPALVVEVLSESTHDTDLDLLHGKGFSYAQAGVHEYLAVDPLGYVLTGDRMRGWRLRHGLYHQWEPEADGRRRSAQMDLTFTLEGMLVTVYSGGVRMPREGEITAELARKDAELARRDAKLARKDAELVELRRTLAALQDADTGKSAG